MKLQGPVMANWTEQATMATSGKEYGTHLSAAVQERPKKGRDADDINRHRCGTQWEELCMLAVP